MLVHRPAPLAALMLSLLSLGSQGEEPVAAKGPLPADDWWTEALDFPMGQARRGRGWNFRHEDKNKDLCKVVRGETVLLDNCLTPAVARRSGSMDQAAHGMHTMGPVNSKQSSTLDDLEGELRGRGDRGLDSSRDPAII